MVKTQVTEFFISQDLKFEMNFPLFPFLSRFSATKGSFWVKNYSKTKLPRLIFLVFLNGFKDVQSRVISFFPGKKTPITLNKKYVIKRLT